MSQRIIRICDGCEFEGIEDPPYEIYVGAKTELTDGRKVDSYECVDLCRSCAAKAFAYVAGGLSDILGQNVVNLISEFDRRVEACN